MSRRSRRQPFSERLARQAAGGLGSRLAGLGRDHARPVSAPAAAPRRGATSGRGGDGAELADQLADREDRDLERRLLEGGPGGRLGELILDLAGLGWRYRRELAPGALAAAVLAVAVFGPWLTTPALWPLPLLVGGLLTAAWQWRTGRPRHRWFAAAVGLAASVLAAAGWRFGVLAGPYLAPLLVLTLALGLPWWRHQLPRSRVELPRGRAVSKSMRAQLRATVTAWPAIAEARGLGGVRLQRATPDEYGFELRVRIPTASRLTVADVVKAVGGLEASLRTRVGAVRVEPDRSRADRALIRVNLTDPLETPVPYPGPSASTIGEPIRLGIFEDRAPLAVLAPGGHWLIGGATGSGKSVAQRVLLAELVQREDVVCWGCDVAKRGVQFVPYVAALARLATEPAEALSMLRAAIAAQQARARWMATEGLTEWPLDRDHPQLVIVIDEVSDLLSQAGIGELLEQLTKLGREQGITVIAATQRASADALGDSAVARAQFGVRIALRCRERADGDLILGQGRAAEGWRPDRLGLPGELLLLSDDHQVPRPGRAYLLPTAEARAIAERAAPHLASLDDVTAAAVAAIEEPARPLAAALPAAMRGPRVPARDRVLALLTAAGADGMTGADLVAALAGEVSRPSVYRALTTATGEQLVSRDDVGVYRIAQAGQRAPDGAEAGG